MIANKSTQRTQNSKPEPRNTELGTRNPELGTRNYYKINNK